MAEEQTFLAEENTIITSSRIVIGGQTFATRNVGSVKVTEESGSMAWPVLITMFTLVAFGAGAPIFGFILGAGAAYSWAKIRSKYKLVIVAGGGEIVALESMDGPEIKKLCNAVAQAIAAR